MNTQDWTHLCFLAEVERQLIDFSDLAKDLLDWTRLTQHLQVAEDRVDDLKTFEC